jgi:hypothetical protein
MIDIIKKSLKDIFSIDVIYFLVKISIISIILAILLIPIYAPLSLLVGYILSFFSWIGEINSISVTYFIIYLLFTIFISIFSAIYSEKLIIKVAKKRYPHIEVVGKPKISVSILITIKSSIIFMILVLLSLPFLFIPIFGQIVMLYLWSILIKEVTIYEVGKLFINDKAILKAKRKKSRLIAIIASSLNYIPILNIFAPIFAQILFLHHILKDNSQN